MLDGIINELYKDIPKKNIFPRRKVHCKLATICFSDGNESRTLWE